VKAARLTAPLLAAATLILIGANALPTVCRKHCLLRERARLERELETERARGARLEAEVDALRNDPFYVERLFVETWHVPPPGAIPLEPAPTPGSSSE